MRTLPLMLAACLPLGFSPAARADQPVPQPLAGIEIEERLGGALPKDVPLVDHHGAEVRLADYLKAGRPVILTLNYYACPTLCSLLLSGLLEGLRGLGFTAGKEFQIVTLSIDHNEKHELAALKRQSYLTALGKPVAEGAWPFLTGSERSIKAVADAAGFHYRYDAQTKQFAHAAGLFVLTPDGRISRVLYGIEFRPQDLRLALVEASRGAIGSPVDRLLLYCYHYDPAARRYGLTPMALMRAGGVLTMLLLGTFLLTMWRRERRASVLHD